MPYGLITEIDAKQLEQALYEAVRRFEARGPLLDEDEEDPRRFRVLEIGVCHGDTSRGIKAFLDGLGWCDRQGNDRPFPLDFWCIDNQRDKPIEAPFPGANLVLGPSEEVYPQIPRGEGFDFVFVDGCHCLNHVALDFLHYGDMVRPGGFLMFHDMAPQTQNKRDYQGHGPRLEDGRAAHPDFGTASREAARLLGLLDNRRTDWRKAWECHDEALNWGGVLVVERLG